jgi:hypothetical protein
MGMDFMGFDLDEENLGFMVILGSNGLMLITLVDYGWWILN